jgi:hypothetical protein
MSTTGFGSMAQLNQAMDEAASRNGRFDMMTINHARSRAWRVARPIAEATISRALTSADHLYYGLTFVEKYNAVHSADSSNVHFHCTLGRDVATSRPWENLHWPLPVGHTTTAQSPWYPSHSTTPRPPRLVDNMIYHEQQCHANRSESLGNWHGVVVAGARTSLTGSRLRLQRSRCECLRHQVHHKARLAPVVLSSCTSLADSRRSFYLLYHRIDYKTGPCDCANHSRSTWPFAADYRYSTASHFQVDSMPSKRRGS